MRRLIYIFLFLFLVNGCKSDNASPQYSISSNIITGTWRLTGEEQGIIGQTNWLVVAGDSSTDVIFRNDGVVMTPTGLPACCAPSSLTVNGMFFEIKPTTPLAQNSACFNVNCTNCLIWDLTVTDKEMIISRCNGPRKRYVRI